MRHDVKTFAIEEVKDLIQHHLNKANAVKDLCESGKLTDALVKAELEEGKYRLSGSIDLQYDEENDSGNLRTTLRNIRYPMSSQIKDKFRKVIHNNPDKLISGTTTDIILNWIYEDGQDTTVSVSEFSVNSDFKIVQK